MDDDGTCLLDVINDPDALGAFLTDDQDAKPATETTTNMDFLGGEGGGSKPAYPDFLSMAMAEADLEPEYGTMDQDPFLNATINSAEIGGIPEQRSSDPLVDDESGLLSSGVSGLEGAPISAVQRMISQSSQPLQHGALTADIPTQNVIHYTAHEHPHREETTSANLQVGVNQQQDSAAAAQGLIQAVSPLQQQGLQLNGQVQQVVQQQGGFQETGIQQAVPQQTSVQQMGLQQAVIQQNGIQQTGIQQAVIQQTGVQPTGIKQGGLQQAVIQQSGLQQTGIQQTLQQAGIQQTRLQGAVIQQSGVQGGGIQQVIVGQGTGNVPQLVFGSHQIIGANVLGSQANILPQGLGTQVLQLGGQQIRPRVVLKQGGGGLVPYDGANKGLKQVLVLNRQTGVLSQVPSNIQLTGQLTIPQQAGGVIGSPQLIIQNAPQQQQTSKGRTTSITTTTSGGNQPVITVAASEGNIIVLKNSAPIFTPASTTLKSITTSTTISTSSSTNVSQSSSKPAKSKQSKSKGKSRRSQQKSSSSKTAVSTTATSVPSVSVSGSKQTQSLGTIPSIQTSSLLPVTAMSSPRVSMTGSIRATNPIRVSLQSSIAPRVNTTTGQSFRMKDSSNAVTVNSVATVSSVQTVGSVPPVGSSVHPSEPAPVISHDAGTVHYRPSQAVPRHQGQDKNPALQQLVQNLRAKDNNERLRSLRELQKLLQQNPQASKQLQTLMKSKLGGTEVSMKKPQSITSTEVTKPPNVYLKPQQTVASVLPFQTTQSKMFPGSIPSTGITARGATPGGGGFTPNSCMSSLGNSQVPTTSSLQTLSGILSSVVTQASMVKEDVRPPPTNNGKLGDVRPSSFNNSSINLDFLNTKPSAPPPLISVSQAIASRGVSMVSPVSSNSLVSPRLTSPQGSISIEASSTQFNVGSVQQQSVNVSTGLVNTLSPSSSSNQTVNQYSAVELSPPPPSQPNVDQQSIGQQNVTRNSVGPQILGQQNVSPSPSFPVNALVGTTATQNQPMATSMQGSNAESSSAIPDVVGGRPGMLPAGSVTPPPNTQLSPSGGSLAAGRPSIAQTAEQLAIRAQLQLQQIQARLQVLMRKPTRTEQETKQLQQLLIYRNRLIQKVKSQLAQLSNQQRLAALTVVQQVRARAQNAAGLMASQAPAANEAVVGSNSATDVIATNSITANSSNSNNTGSSTKAGGAFSSLPMDPHPVAHVTPSSSANLEAAGLSVQVSPQQISPTPLSSPPGSSKQIQNALITSTTSRQDPEKTARGTKQKAATTAAETDWRNANKKIKVSAESALMSQSFTAGNTGSGLLKAKLLADSSQLSKSMPAASAATPQGQQGTSAPTKDQLKSQQYQHTMKMLEEKLRSMSPAQQREFLLQYQPLLQKFTQAGQKLMPDKKLEGAAGILNNIFVNRTNASPRQQPTQGNTSKESKSSKRGAFKSSTPTLLQLISGGNGEAKPKKHEKKVKVPNKSELVAKQLKRDRQTVSRPEMKKGFKSRSDAVSRLLSFHITQDDSPTEEHLDKFDREFEDHSAQLLQSKSEMLAKYRYLLLKEGMRRGPSAEMVMLDRFVVQDEKHNFEYEKQLAKNPETHNRLLAIIKPNQSKKERFLNAAVAYGTTAAKAVLKQEPSLPPKKRAHIETIPEVDSTPLESRLEMNPTPVKSKLEADLAPVESKPENDSPPVESKPVENHESKQPSSPETPISKPQITKNDFRTKITIKIPKAAYQSLSPAPSSGDTMHSSLSSPDLLSPRSDAGSEASSIRSENSLSPRVRLRRHSTLQALLMSESPLEVNINDLKGDKKKTVNLDGSRSPAPSQNSQSSCPPPASQTRSSKSECPPLSNLRSRNLMNLLTNTPEKVAVVTTGKGKRKKTSKEVLPSKEVLTNGKRNSVASSKKGTSVFDFEEDYSKPTQAHPFEPMDVLQDSLQDEMNCTINNILGLQRPSPDEGDHGGMNATANKGILPSAVFESHSNDDDFFDSVGTLDSSYGNMEEAQETSAPREAISNLESELDIMMEGDETLDSRISGISDVL